MEPSKKADHRLVVEPQLLGLERLAKRLFDLDALLGLLAESCVEYFVTSRSMRLGPVHRDIGIAQQPLRVQVVCSGHHDANARGYAVPLAAEGEGAEECLPETFGDSYSVAC